MNPTRIAATCWRATTRAAAAAAVCLLPVAALAQGASPQQLPAWSDTAAFRALACTACHGGQGKATAEGYVPRLAGKPAGYLFDQMTAFRDGRRSHRGMARLMENVGDAQLRELAGYFSALQLPYPPPALTPPAPAAAARAQRIVRQGLPEAGVPACDSCHGSSLTGDDPQVPGLLGLPRDYLIGQLGAWRNDIRHGRNPDCMATVARRLPAADIAVLADWLAAQPVPPAVHAVSASAPPPAARAPELKCAEPAPVTPDPAATGTRGTPGTPDDPVARGAYLARVGNCAGCHSRGQRAGAPELSGGAGLVTSFGTVYAGNLTPDAATGLGRWSADDFWRALHEGRGRDGRRLVPVFPYTSYTQMTREDSDALFAYLRSLPAVARKSPEHALRFPYGTQAALTAWQWLFFSPARAPSATATRDLEGRTGTDPLWARGRYLVEGPGHCLECHAPRGRWGQRGDDGTGGLMPLSDWWVPALHGPARQTEDDVVALLRDGRNRHGSATGPMAEVVSTSTSGWTEADLRAIARYLASLPRQAAPASDKVAASDVQATGRRLYEDRCAACHGVQGQGVGAQGALRAIAPLAGNPSVTQPRVNNLVLMLRHGGFGAATAALPRPFGMPPQALSVAEQAAVLSYIRQAWGNRAGAVSEVDLTVLP